METKQTTFDWKVDKRWVDAFEPEIKRILGQTFIRTAPERMDMEEATDLLVLEIRPFTIACRVRRNNYYPKYIGEFTIRKSRPSGMKCEIDKICEGWGDYYFYGFSNESEDGSGFVFYSLLDLKVFRRELIHNGKRHHLQYGTKPNWDDSSDFLWFKISSFPKDFILCQFGGR